MIRLGDGTGESHQKMENALEYLWPFTSELFEQTCWNSAFIDLESINTNWHYEVETILREATLQCPQIPSLQSGGLKGMHTEHMGYILAEMQYLQRVYPGNEW